MMKPFANYSSPELVWTFVDNILDSRFSSRNIELGSGTCSYEAFYYYSVRNTMLYFEDVCVSFFFDVTMDSTTETGNDGVSRSKS